jgi:hypothetical protein
MRPTGGGEEVIDHTNRNIRSELAKRLGMTEHPDDAGNFSMREERVSLRAQHLLEGGEYN